MTTTNEPRNEKGLTKEEYWDRVLRYHKRLGGTALSIGLIGLGSIFYHGYNSLSGLPPQPEGYQQYVDVNETLENLQSLKDTFEIPRVPYMTEELSDSLAGAFGVEREKEQKLEQAVSIVKDDIVRMETENPAYANFEDEIKAYRETAGKRMMYSGFATFLGLLGLVCIANKKSKKPDSDNFVLSEGGGR